MRLTLAPAPIYSSREAVGECLLLLFNCSVASKTAWAYADLLGIEGFDHRRDRLRQADTLVLSIYFYVRTGPAKDCCSLKAKIINNRQLPGLVFAKLTFDGHAAPG